MNGFIEKTEKISQVAAWCSGLLLFLAAIMIAFEVIMRKAFSYSIGGADELSSYALAISCTWGFSFALIRKSHIRIDILYNHLPQAGRSFLDIFAHLLLGIYIVTLSYYAFFVLKTSILKHSAANTPLATPLWIPQGLWFLGLLWFGFTIFIVLAGTIYYRLNNKHNEANRLAGISTLDDEIQETTERGTTAGGDK
ncbi:TRAP transporter small permease subunit [Desulforhopalus sp. IMCC35007]|uniref:TRAP transporter small permease subunit n=1 Tax=Desulforhopalus sp. IMCC35007 TaxID=2569543 RepID=UPI0010AE6EFC|nr:TRAP transporter small permease [Desulforhopalus sp. IMCC35007]TKB08829.1 TRAP transporter small permease [Desulforhopalus sp. IMCC35007]